MLSSDDACSSKWTPRKLCAADRGWKKHDGRLLAGRVQKLSAQSATAWVQIEDKRGHHGAHPGAYREAARQDRNPANCGSHPNGASDDLSASICRPMSGRPSYGCRDVSPKS